MEQQKQKLKPTFRMADDFLDLKTAGTNAIIQQLEENIKFREMSLEKRLKHKQIMQ